MQYYEDFEDPDMTVEDLLFYDAQDEFLFRMSGGYEDEEDEKQGKTSQMVGVSDAHKSRYRSTPKRIFGICVGRPLPARPFDIPPSMVGKRIMVKNAKGVLQTVRFTLHYVMADEEQYFAQTSELTLRSGEVTFIPEAFELFFTEAHTISVNPEVTLINPALLPLAVPIFAKVEKMPEIKGQTTEPLQSNIHLPKAYLYCDCFIWQAYLLNKESGERRYSNTQERDKLLEDRHKEIEEVIKWIIT